MGEADTVQVVMRRNEYCERCGAKNAFRKDKRVIQIDGNAMWYAKCNRCGAWVKIYWTD